MVTKKDILDVYAFLRTKNQSIPDEVLDFIKDASLEKLKANSGAGVSYKAAPNWYLVLQGLRSYLATYKRLEKDNLLMDYELHEYGVIKESIDELEKAL